MQEVEGLAWQREGGIVTITLNRPDKLNALNFRMVEGLIAWIDECGLDDAVRAVRGMPGVARAANVTYFTMQVQAPDGSDTRAMVVGIEVGQPGEPTYLQIGRAHV